MVYIIKMIGGQLLSRYKMFKFQDFFFFKNLNLYIDDKTWARGLDSK